MNAFILASLALSMAPAQQHTYLVGGTLSAEEKTDLKTMLGKSVRLDFADFGHLPRHSKADTVIVSIWPNTGTKGWQESLDGFVPKTKSRLADIKRRFSASRRYVLLNQAKTEADRTDLIPLLSQAARESGWEVLDLNRSTVPGRSTRKLYALLVPAQLNPGNWRVLSATSEETGEGPAKDAIDGNPNSYWHTRWSSNPTRMPHEIVLDLGSVRTLAGFSYLARQDGGVNGRVKGFEFYLSEKSGVWAAPVMKGDLQNTPIEQRLLFDHAVRGRFLKFRALSEVNGNIWTTCAELGILTSGD